MICLNNFASMAIKINAAYGLPPSPYLCGACVLNTVNPIYAERITNRARADKNVLLLFRFCLFLH